MDLAFLHMLQDLRHSLPGFFETFFVALSWIGDGPALVALALVVYWCVDKRVGQRAITALALGVFANHLIKNVACVYRPWVRDATIVPAEAAIEGAGGYSFPSGHVSGTSSALGSLAWQERKGHRWVVVMGAVVIALMMFARTFLGVHTPQDVVVGLALGIAGIAAAQCFFAWVEAEDERNPGNKIDAVVAVVVCAAVVATLLFVSNKPYPLDYVGGELLVDPVAMQKGCFETSGLMVGWALAWLLERRLVGFATEGLDLRTRIIRGVIGVGLVGVSYLVGSVVFKMLLPTNPAKLLQMGTVAFVAAFVAPLAFSAWERRQV